MSATSPERAAEILQRLAAGQSIRQICREMGAGHEAVKRVQMQAAGELQDVSTIPNPVPNSPAFSLPLPAPEAGGPSLPLPAEASYEPFQVAPPGVWGILCDPHIPYHDLATIQAWIDDCKRMGATGLLLNGDILDCYQVSSHHREPSKPRMREEIEKGRQLLEYLRGTFPRARIIYKVGNHEERLARYLQAKAEEVYDLEEIHLQALLRVQQFGIEWVQDRRVIMLGKLPVIHGHEYQGGGGVMPARWLFLRTGESAMMGHFHQPTYYTFCTISGKEVGMWSVGCACHRSPQYRPLNQWGHGWAVVEVDSGGGYHVHNRRRLRDGRVV